jgi:glycerophosphoryl diester phosphodiesterase
VIDPVFVERDGHRTWLKWHRARRRAGDPVFTGRRILEGMALGASVEVDLVVHGGGGMAVLHDTRLDRETTGTGSARDTAPEVLRGLNLRGEDGASIPDKVMLLEDLAALIAKDGAHPDALLQLDFKEDEAALSPEVVEGFRATLAGVAGHFILSSGDAPAVAALSAGLPDLRIGHDPCHGDALERLRQGRDYTAFVAEALAPAGRADLIYLEYPVLLAAQADGFDLVGAFHSAGKRIDAYTIKRADGDGVALARQLVALGVDQITTDDPEGLWLGLTAKAVP